LSLPGMALFWLYDARSFLADISVGFHSNGDHGDYDVALGAYYPFARTDFSPYFGGGLRYAHSQYGGTGASGIALQAPLGVLLGRLSGVQIRGERGYFVNLYAEPVKSGATLTAPSSDSVHSHGMMLSLGIGF